MKEAVFRSGSQSLFTLKIRRSIKIYFKQKYEIYKDRQNIEQSRGGYCIMIIDQSYF